MARTGYARLLRDIGFEALLGTRFLGMTVVAFAAHRAAAGRIEWLLAVFLVLIAQARFSMPVSEAQLTRAAALLQLATFIGFVAGTFLYRKGGGLVILGIFITGALLSLRIPRTPAARPASPLSVCGIAWFWFVAAVLYVSQTDAGFLVAGIGVGGMAAGALSGEYGELGLVPIGLALMGIFLVTPHAFITPIAIGCGAGLFVVPLKAVLRREATAAAILSIGVVWFMRGQIHAHADIVIPALGLVTLAGFVILVVRDPAPVVRFVLWSTAMMLFRIRLEGRENIPQTGAALLVSNHISYADAVLVGCATRLRTIHFLMWQPIYDTPVANYFFRVLQAIPIDAASPKSTVRALRAAREQLQRGELVGIFPEGSISRTGEIEPFERGFEKILQGTDALVIPIRIDGLYGHPLSRKGGAEFRSWEKLWRPRVTVRIGAPVRGELTGIELRQSVVNLIPDSGLEPGPVAQN